MHFAHWFLLHRQVLDAAALDALLGMSAWIVLAVGRISFATCAFAALGASATAWLIAHHWPYPAALIAAMLAATATAALLGFALSPIGGPQFALATFCLGEFALIRMPAAIVHVPRQLGFLPYGSLIAIALGFWIFWMSRDGRAARAVAGDATAAAAYGIDPRRCIHAALILSAIPAGVAGAVAALSGAGADFGMQRSVAALAFAWLGGSGNVLGALAGTAVLHAIPIAASRLAPFSYVIDDAALLGACLLLPRGILGLLHALPLSRRTRERVA